jgi:hypothetical protein
VDDMKARASRVTLGIALAAALFVGMASIAAAVRADSFGPI